MATATPRKPYSLEDSFESLIEKDSLGFYEEERSNEKTPMTAMGTLGFNEFAAALYRSINTEEMKENPNSWPKHEITSEINVDRKIPQNEPEPKTAPTAGEVLAKAGGFVENFAEKAEKTIQTLTTVGKEVKGAVGELLSWITGKEKKKDDKPKTEEEAKKKAEEQFRVRTFIDALKKPVKQVMKFFRIGGAPVGADQVAKVLKVSGTQELTDEQGNLNIKAAADFEKANSEMSEEQVKAAKAQRMASATGRSNGMAMNQQAQEGNSRIVGANAGG